MYVEYTLSFFVMHILKTAGINPLQSEIYMIILLIQAKVKGGMVYGEKEINKYSAENIQITGL